MCIVEGVNNMRIRGDAYDADRNLGLGYTEKGILWTDDTRGGLKI